MPDAAQSLWPNGPSSMLGNEERTRSGKPGALPLLDLSDPKYDEITNDYEKGEMKSAMEDAVDAHIAKHKDIKVDTIIPVLRSNGAMEYYKYLGPNSGGRKDWMGIAPPKDVPMS